MSEINLVSPPEAHYTVYKLTDPEGRIYIGCTGKPVAQRWEKGWGYSKNTPIRAAIDTLGWDAFQKEVLCEKLIKEGAEKLEKWFIACYDSSHPEKGYNRFLGGLGKGARMSEETKKSIRIAKKKLFDECPELREKIRNGVLTAYKNDPGYRERISKGICAAYAKDPALRIRMSDISKQHWEDPEYRSRVTKGKVAFFDGNTEAACKLQEKIRQYYREHPEKRREIAERVSRYLMTPEGRKFAESDRRSKAVRCVETGVEYPSQSAAERATGFSHIHSVCSGKHRTAGGYHWENIIR